MTNNTETSSQEKQELLIQAAKKRLLNFCQLLNNKYEAVWFHELLATKLEEVLEKVQNKQKARLILTIPPRHGKSQLASIYFPAWALGKYPDMKFIFATYGADLAEKMGLSTRDVINHEGYKAIFPGVELRQDVKAKAKWMTNKNGSYTAVGAGGAITGAGGNIILCDDLVKSRDEAESENMQNFVWEYYRSTLYSRLEGYGAVIVIMQRWNQNDIVARLLDEDERKRLAGEQTEEWEVINFPAIAEDDEIINGKLVRKQGEALWPAKFPLPVLENIRSTAGVYNFVSQYQQDPIATESQEFKEHHFKYFNEEDLVGKYLRYYTLIDPAISQKKSADNSVVLTIAKEVNGPNWYRIREDAGKLTPTQTIDLIFLHQSQYGSEVSLETVAYQLALKFAILEEQKKRERYFVVNEVKTSTNKETRIRGLLPLYETGVIYHRKADVEYERELLSFPRGRRDDRCAFGETLITTSEGDKPIKNVVVGDFVLTRSGFKKVLVSGKTGTKKVVTNFGLSMTENHPVWTRMGWIFLADLRDYDIITVCTKQLLGMGLSIKDIQTLHGETIGSISKGESMAESPISIVINGWRKTVQFLKDFIYTISIKTPSIILSKIYSVLAMLSTTPFMWMSVSLLGDPQNGIQVSGGVGGVRTNRDGFLKRRPPYLNAWFVINLLKISLIPHLFFVGGNANRDRADKTLLNKKNWTGLNILKRLIKFCAAAIVGLKFEMPHGENIKSVRPVKKSDDTRFAIGLASENKDSSTAESVPPLFEVTAQGLNSALKNVPISGRCVDSGSVVDVYNLTVEGVNEYFANGVLVHNCDTMSMALGVIQNTGGSRIKQYRPKWLGYGKKAE